jgi:hypothetical protein
VVLTLVPFANAQDEAEPIPDEAAKKRLLIQEAGNALMHLKRSLEKDGFYSGRVALNVWRNAAIDAGIFDQTLYEGYKKKLYEKSVAASRSCFEEFLLEKSFHDANICLQIWRIHSKELNTYDREEYELLKTRLTDAKAGKTSENAEDQKVE